MCLGVANAAFEGCTSFTGAGLENWDVAQVTDFRYSKHSARTPCVFIVLSVRYLPVLNTMIAVVSSGRWTLCPVIDDTGQHSRIAQASTRIFQPGMLAQARGSTRVSAAQAIQSFYSIDKHDTLCMFWHKSRLAP